MCELSTFQFPFLTIDKMCAILNGIKCAVINGNCAVLHDAFFFFFCSPPLTQIKEVSIFDKDNFFFSFHTRPLAGN